MGTKTSTISSLPNGQKIELNAAGDQVFLGKWAKTASLVRRTGLIADSSNGTVDTTKALR